MLSVNQIASLVRHQAFDRLFERVVANGLHIARETQRHLLGPADLVPVAIGLGLVRVSELTWRPHRAGQELVMALRDRQRPGGMFSTAGPGSAVGTAVALLGLHAWRGLLGECRALRPMSGPDTPVGVPTETLSATDPLADSLTEMIDRASRALAACGTPPPIVILTPGQLVLTVPACRTIVTPATAA